MLVVSYPHANCGLMKLSQTYFNLSDLRSLIFPLYSREHHHWWERKSPKLVDFVFEILAMEQHLRSDLILQDTLCPKLWGTSVRHVGQAVRGW